MQLEIIPPLSRFYCLLIAVLLSGDHLFAQDSSEISFGKITVADFNQSVPSIDTGASAIILMDIGKTHFELSRSPYARYDMVFSRFIRVKVLKKSGFNSATFEIGLREFKRGIGEYMTDLRGTTYNLENGSIVESRLDEGSVFTDKFTKNYSIRKFSMPGLKEGSIYEVAYTTRSTFSMIDSWSFQHEYPCRWSEYDLDFFSDMSYSVKIQGSQPFYVNSQIAAKNSSLHNRWVKRDVPAIKVEDNISSIKNYVDKISFRLSSFDIKDEKTSYQGWKKLSEFFIYRNELTETLDSDNPWLDQETLNIVGTETNKSLMSRMIYKWVRDHFKNTGRNSISALNDLKDIFKNKSGNEAEINFLLLAFLRHIKIPVYPAILSTRENGFAELAYPQMNDYNYMICVLYENGQAVTLDASQPNLPYGRLLSNCYNGGIRIINEDDPKLLRFTPDSLLETETTNLFIANDEKGEYSGSLSTIYGRNRSYAIREEIRKKSKKDYLREHLIKIDDGIDFENMDFDSLEDYDMPLTLHMDMEFKKLLKGDVIYFDPLVGFPYNKNPFISAERLYPVELPYKQDYVFLLSMDIPKGFQVDELPKSARIKLDGDQGVFEYIVQGNPDNIQMQVHLKLNKTTFLPEDYMSLREFFADVEKKEAEQIVLKRIR